MVWYFIAIVEITSRGQQVLLPIGPNCLVQGLSESKLQRIYLWTVEKVFVGLVEDSGLSVLENPVQEIGCLHLRVSVSPTPDVTNKCGQSKVHKSGGDGEVENGWISQKTSSNSEACLLGLIEESCIEHICEMSANIWIDIRISVNLLFSHFSYSLLLSQKIKSH